MSPQSSLKHANGYVHNVAPHRRRRLLEASHQQELVAEVVGDFSHPRSHPLVCFVGFDDGAVTHLALGRRGRRAGTDLKRLNFTELTALSAPASHIAILERLPSRFRPHVEKRLSGGGLLPQGSFLAVVEALRELLPETHPLLERFSASRAAAINDLTSSARLSLAYQRETVATALAIAGLDVTQLQSWTPRREERKLESFLDGLPEARLREDQMVIADLTSLPGFDLVRTTQHATALFTNDRVTLTVVMANHLPLEQQLGADLIYRNETYGSFVVVQYKAMEDEAGTQRYRLPNHQLALELHRMDEVWSELQKCLPDTDLSGFRLKENPFFLKLCPRVVFDPDSGSLIKGMYIPLEYWRRLEDSPQLVGPFDGRSVTYGNIGRYLNNTMFTELVAGGWIGTVASQSAVLDAVIRQCLESGRTVTIAVKRDVAPGSAVKTASPNI